MFAAFVKDDRLLLPNGQCHAPRECRSFHPLSSWFAHFPLFCHLPTNRTTSRRPIPLQTPREAVEPNKSNLFLVGTLMWHRKGVIADTGKIVDYHIGIHEHGAHLSAWWTEEGTQDKMECGGRVRIDWLTCDEHWSNPLRLYVNNFV